MQTFQKSYILVTCRCLQAPQLRFSDAITRTEVTKLFNLEISWSSVCVVFMPNQTSDRENQVDVKLHKPSLFKFFCFVQCPRSFTNLIVCKDHVKSHGNCLISLTVLLYGLISASNPVCFEILSRRSTVNNICDVRTHAHSHKYDS